MCGIIGYIGQKQAYPLLLAGLEKLEYRGYDSAGIALSHNNTLSIIKKKGRVEVLKSTTLPGTIGIAHTRWALERFNKSKINLLIIKEERMNILNLIDEENYYVQINLKFKDYLNNQLCDKKEKVDLKEISKKTTYRIRKTPNYWINLKTLLNITELLEIKKEEVIENIIKIKTHNSFPIEFNINNLISASFFRIIGHIIGDGGIHVIEKEKKYRAFYVNNQKELLDSFTQDITTVFGKFKIYSRTREEHGDEIWLPTTIGFMLYNLLKYEALNKKKRVPQFIFDTQDKKLLSAFLQALYDDEGFLYPNKNMIVIAQKSKELIEDIRKIVIKIGIEPNQLLIHKSKNRTTMHYFSITSKENIIKFHQNINFIHPIKNKKLEELIKKYR